MNKGEYLFIVKYKSLGIIPRKIVFKVEGIISWAQAYEIANTCSIYGEVEIHKL